MPRPEKVKAVETIAADLRGTDTYYLLDFRGLTVAESMDLRHRLKDVGASLRVVKNTLARRAAEQAGVPNLEALLEGPTAIAFCSEDPVQVAKMLQTFIREKKKMTIKGGYLSRGVISPQQVDQLASLPGREEMIGRVIGSVASPLYGLVNVLSGPIRGLAMVLNQIKEQKAGAAA